MSGRWIALTGTFAALFAASACAAKSPGSSTPPISALTALPRPGSLPARVDTEVRALAPGAGIAASAAVLKTRLLRTNVRGRAMYAFGGSGGHVCFLVVDGVGTCGQITSAAEIFWAVTGDKKHGQAVAGMVSDRVVALSVQIGKRHVRVKPFHNSFSVSFQPGTGRGVPAVSVSAVLG